MTPHTIPPRTDEHLAAAAPSSAELLAAVDRHLATLAGKITCLANLIGDPVPGALRADLNDALRALAAAGSMHRRELEDLHSSRTSAERQAQRARDERDMAVRAVVDAVADWETRTRLAHRRRPSAAPPEIPGFVRVAKIAGWSCAGEEEAHDAP